MSGRELDPDGTDSYHPEHPWEQTGHHLYVAPEARTKQNWPPIKSVRAVGIYEREQWDNLPDGDGPVPVKIDVHSEEAHRIRVESMLETLIERTFGHSGIELATKKFLGKVDLAERRQKREASELATLKTDLAEARALRDLYEHRIVEALNYISHCGVSRSVPNRVLLENLLTGRS